MNSFSASIFKSAVCRTNCFPRPNPTLFYFPGIDNRNAILPKSSFPEISSLLQTNHDIILQEYLNLKSLGLKNDYDAGDHKLHEGKWNWHSYLLKGNRQSSFAANCPRTVDILESFSAPKLMVHIPFSFAFFSVLGKQSSIAAHYGPCNLRVRCHYPLVVPKDADKCGMEVGGKQVQWKVGEPLFFDDSYEHKVWNHSDEERVVLLFDIWHPDLTENERLAITDMFEYAKQQGWWNNSNNSSGNHPIKT